MGEMRRMPSMKMSDGVIFSPNAQGRQQNQFGPRIEAVDIGARIGLGVPQPLGLG